MCQKYELDFARPLKYAIFIINIYILGILIGLIVYLLFEQLILKSTNTIIAVPSDRDTIVKIESYKNIETKKGSF